MDLKEKLMTSYKDEEKGAKEYQDLADLADEQFPDKGYGSILRTMSKEEGLHRSHLKAILTDMGVET